MTKRLIYGFFLYLFLSGACSLELSDPRDPESSNYQGYITVIGLDRVDVVHSQMDTYSVNLLVNSCSSALKYQFQVARSDGFIQITYDLITDSNDISISLHLLHEGTYFWRARAIDSQGSTGKWTSTGELELDQYSFSGFYPQRNGKILTTTPKFLWDAIEDACQYEIQIARNDSDIESGPIGITDENSFIQREDLIIDEYYQWRIRALDEEGYRSLWSDTSRIFISGYPVVSVEGGSFEMGNTWDSEGASEEYPVHSVTLSDFYIAETEVTIEQWFEVYNWALRNGYQFPSYYSGIGHNSLLEPIRNISANNAIVWCNAFSEYLGLEPVYVSGSSVLRYAYPSYHDIKNSWFDREANGFRLPTEAEWEYAAKGGQYDSNNGSYAGSYNADDVAWYSENSDNVQPVRGKNPNELGLYDMCGNVQEWCWDGYSDYSSLSQTDPCGPSVNTSGYYSNYRVVRGGSFSSNDNGIRISYRKKYGSLTSYFKTFGFRPVRNIE